jgi:SAM-dependent methyltransferase
MFILDKADIRAAASTYGVSIAGRVSRKVHPADTMWYLAKKPIGYANHGASAVATIQSVCAIAGHKPRPMILDFGCGHGRVGRWLRAAFPDSSLTGSEILPSAVKFYAETFKAGGWTTSVNLAANSPGKTFDLIWSGSVFTHLPVDSARLLYRQFIDWLNPGGLAIFSAHGRISTSVFRSGSVPKTDRSVANAAIATFDRGDFGFSPYDDQENYGMSYTPPSWWVSTITRSPDVRLISYSEGGWAGNQDIVAVQKIPPSYVAR